VSHEVDACNKLIILRKKSLLEKCRADSKPKDTFHSKILITKAVVSFPFLSAMSHSAEIGKGDVCIARDGSRSYLSIHSEKISNFLWVGPICVMGFSFS
jgi:hypothetical protein